MSAPERLKNFAKTYPREWASWRSMIARCIRERHPRYHRYGGRGITVCDRWRESFWNFFDDMGRRSVGMTLDRIDYDGNYEAGNCRWATVADQARNSINAKLTMPLAREIRRRIEAGEGRTLLAREYGISPPLVTAIMRQDRWKEESA